MKYQGIQEIVDSVRKYKKNSKLWELREYTCMYASM